MINDQGLILNDNVEDSTHQLASITSSRNLIIAYVPNGAQVQIDLSKMNAKKVQATWFNPRDGTKREIGMFSTNEKPIFEPWSKGWGSDFVLVIMAEGMENSRF
ncbi:MAG: hypothetical protein IPL46_16145 [Saprospiraceae bacterium]|nr:hypothetical protein [Saprospiraceae bacterium]